MMSRLILKICFDRFKSLPRDENGAALMITLAVALFLYLLCSASYAIGDGQRKDPASERLRRGGILRRGG